MKRQSFWVAVGIVVAATLGAGIFSLPYVFKEAGWLVGFIYLAVLAPAVIFAHVLYYRALARVDERNRLLGLVRKNLGGWLFAPALIAIVGGLILGLLGGLILGGKFIELIFPPLGGWGILIFWLLGSLPLALGNRRFAAIEVAGAILVFLLALLMFSAAVSGGGVFTLPAFQFKNIFLPFGAVLFALAGWTAVEPVFEFAKRRAIPRTAMVFAAGTLVVVATYLLFIAGVLGAGGKITADTVSGIADWTFWQKILLFALGLLSLLGIYRLVSLEVKNSLVSDMRWSSSAGYLAALTAPLLLYLLGLNSFLRVVGLAGGVFLSLQYFFIILVSQKILSLSGIKRFTASCVAALFLAGAAYQLYYFLL